MGIFSCVLQHVKGEVKDWHYNNVILHCCSIKFIFFLLRQTKIQLSETDVIPQQF